MERRVPITGISIRNVLLEGEFLKVVMVKKPVLTSYIEGAAVKRIGDAVTDSSGLEEESIACLVGSIKLRLLVVEENTVHARSNHTSCMGMGMFDVCVCACVRVCCVGGWVYVCLLSPYSHSPEVVNAQAKVSGEHMFVFQIFESSCHCHINRIEGGKKCQFEVCMLTDTQHSSMYIL